VALSGNASLRKSFDDAFSILDRSEKCARPQECIWSRKLTDDQAHGMNAHRWQRVREVFHAAVEMPPEKRSAYLGDTCHDAEIRREVESLLHAHGDAADLLEAPPVNLSAIPQPADQRDPWIGNFIGPYQVIARIGQGGMGAVYRAVRVDEHYVKQVAIKLVKPGLAGDQYLRRFKNERQIMASLDHPNIARLLDAGTANGSPYFVMEFIDGEHIDTYCDKHHLNTHTRLELFLEVCSALQYAHQHLVVHRDLKPGNILITSDGTPKLLDFGIAKLLDPEIFLQTTALTLSEEKPMTPEFASPEQIRGEAITTSSDVYSLGVLLYRLLTGHSPYQLGGQPLHELARAISETEPVRPSLVIDRVTEETSYDGKPVRLTPQFVSRVRDGHVESLRNRLAGDLDNILLKALRKEPGRRYVSVEQFAEDIRRHLEGLPVLARKDTIRYRTLKFVERNKAGVAAGALVALSLVGGMVATAWQAHIARQERARAERRFNDVRRLTNALIFDMEEAISDLPRSTAARKLLLDNALQYLDSLAKEATGDVTLQRELAAAYKKLGDVQGNPFHGNVGDSTAALESYRKVVSIRETLVAANPRDKEEGYALAAAHRALGQMLVSTGDLQGGMVSATKALAIMETLAVSNPREYKILDELENAYELIGDIQGGNGVSANLGDLPGALESHRKALAIAEQALRLFPDDPRAQRAVALYQLKIGEDQVELGDRALGVENYRKGLEIYKAQVAKTPSAQLTRDLHVIYTRIGNAQLMDGNSKGAIENYRTALGLIKTMGIDPQDALSRTDLATTEAILGQAMAQSGDKRGGLALLSRAIAKLDHEVALDPKHVEIGRALGLLYVWRGQIFLVSNNLEGALADFRKATSIFGRISASDAHDADTRINLAAAEAKIADALVPKGDLDAAGENYRKVQSVIETFAHSVPPNVQAQYTLADTYSGLGVIFQKRATQVGVSADKQREHWNEARSWFQKSFDEWRQVRNPGVMSPGGFDADGPGMVAQKLAACDAALHQPSSKQSASISTPAAP
jgi:serine/threonine protein kinase/tetratricopeptide (TPR) repeat protein